MTPARRSTITLAAVLSAIAMLALPGAAAAKDRNHDRIPDRWEKRHHLSLGANQAHRDQDRDRLRNRAEFLAGTNPRNADTDGDGIPDCEENAGKIASFEPASGRLVIDVFGGPTVSGLVAEETEIECDGQNSGTSASGPEDDEESTGDDQQSEEPGDDDWGREEWGDEDDPVSNCTSADLEVGAVVHEAELQIENGSAVFEKVELAG
jgi:hypothetical protein